MPAWGLGHCQMGPTSLFSLPLAYHICSERAKLSEKRGFTRNRTHPTLKINPYLLPKTHTNITGTMFGIGHARRKRGKIRPVGTISHEGMRHATTLKLCSIFLATAYTDPSFALSSMVASAIPVRILAHPLIVESASLLPCDPSCGMENQSW